jgi:hypothetical protein
LPDELISRNRVNPSPKKYFALSEPQITGMVAAVPRPLEGRFAVVTDVGVRDAMDVLDRETSDPGRTAKSRGPGLPTLRSSWRMTSPAATVAKKPGTPGRARIRRNTIVQGRPDRTGRACGF